VCIIIQYKSNKLEESKQNLAKD